MDINKIRLRQEALQISFDDISVLTGIQVEEVKSFFHADNINAESIEKITNLLGLDSFGNEITDIQTLREKRAEEKALYIVSLVQDTSSLEMQGLESNELQTLIEETKKQFLTGEHKALLWKT